MSDNLVNWQEEHEKYQKDGSKGSFVSWLIVEGLSRAVEEAIASGTAKTDADKKYFADLAIATNHWTECKITMQINGVEVPAQKTIDTIEEQLDMEVEKKALSLLHKYTRINNLLETIHTAEKQIELELRKFFSSRE